ncbi:MAG: hypothetical protein NTV54_08345 [Ignavibacteriales bacterium]|nr:hypothetical protein [Ignavibacteriales bacterium]
MKHTAVMLCLHLCLTPFVWSQDNASSLPTRKCGFPFFVQQAERLSHDKVLRRQLSTRVETETSILSPSGHFRIHYDTSLSSSRTPALLDSVNQPRAGTYHKFADSVARIFDNVWNAEISHMGFSAPPSDNGAGGGNEYDIYIINMRVKYPGMIVYGETSWDDADLVNPGENVPRYASYIEIERQFGAGFRTKGLAAARVAAAHEFFHAIQIGGYGWWGLIHRYFYEFMAESMESAIYPEVKDYVDDANKDYLPFINTLSLAEAQTDFGYGRAIFGIYFRLKYGVAFIRDTWEHSRQVTPLAGLVEVTAQNGSTMRKELSDFATWCYFTGPRSVRGRYFPDADTLSSVAFAADLSMNQLPFSYVPSPPCPGYTIHYFRVKSGADTSVCIVVNADNDDAVALSGGRFLFHLNFGTQTGSEWKPLNAWYNYQFKVDNPAVWNSFVLTGAGWQYVASEKPFPNPYRPAAGALSIPLAPSVSGSVEVTILDGSLHQVCQRQAMPSLQMGMWQVPWDGRDQKGNIVPSGIYLYFVRGTDYQKQGKFAVLR